MEPARKKVNGRKFALVGFSIRTCQVNNQIMFVGRDDKTTVAIRDTGSNYISRAIVINESETA